MRASTAVAEPAPKPAARARPTPAAELRIPSPVEASHACPGWPPARLALGISGGAGLAALLVYLRTVAPVLPPGDSGELITAAWILGVAHPPGYPLFTMLGHLFGLLPFGSPALRVNLLSAVLGAASVGLTCLLTYRLLGRGGGRPHRSPLPEGEGEGAVPQGEGEGAVPQGEGVRSHPSPLAGGEGTVAAVGAAVGGLLLAFSNAFWSYTLVAEVFPLNSFFGALLLLLLEWERRPERAGLLWAFALGCGLAATNHHTIVLLGPAFLVLLASVGWRLWRAETGRRGDGEAEGRGDGEMERWREGETDGRKDLLSVSPSLYRSLAVAGGLLVVGLVPYLYLPLAAGQDPPLNWSNPRTLDAFWRHVTRADYGTFRLVLQEQPGGGTSLEQVRLLAGYLYRAFTPLGCLLAAVGAWWLARNRAIQGLALLLAFLVGGPLFVAYADPNISDPLVKGVLERFYILPSVPFGVAIGAGAFQLFRWAPRLRLPPEQARYAAPVLGVALLALSLVSAGTKLGLLDQSGDFVDYHYAQDLLAPVDPGALLLVRGDIVIFGIDYLQIVEGQRSDIVALDMEKLKLRSYVQQMRDEHPDVTIPFELLDQNRPTSLISLAEANMANRPVYVAGDPPRPQELRSGFDVARAGFADRLLPKGDGPDRNAILREKIELFRQLHYPSQTYPDTTWEAGIARDYGRIAFDVGFVLTVDGRLTDAVAMYRTSIRLVPEYPLPYKNLGLVLLQLGSDPSEVAGLWERYLKLNPSDPQAPAMQQQVDRIRGRAP